jgi:hypothetical protein
VAVTGPEARPTLMDTPPLDGSSTSISTVCATCRSANADERPARAGRSALEEEYAQPDHDRTAAKDAQKRGLCPCFVVWSWNWGTVTAPRANRAMRAAWLLSCCSITLVTARYAAPPPHTQRQNHHLPVTTPPVAQGDAQSRNTQAVRVLTADRRVPQPHRQLETLRHCCPHLRTLATNRLTQQQEREKEPCGSGQNCAPSPMVSILYTPWMSARVSNSA